MFELYSFDIKAYQQIQQELKFGNGRQCLDGLCCFLTKRSQKAVGGGINTSFGLFQETNEEDFIDNFIQKLWRFQYACGHLRIGLKDSCLELACLNYDERPAVCKTFPHGDTVTYSKKECPVNNILSSRQKNKSYEFYAFRKGTHKLKRFSVGWLLKRFKLFDLVPVPENLYIYEWGNITKDP